MPEQVLSDCLKKSHILTDIAGINRCPYILRISVV